MPIVVVGLNHKTAPLGLLERLSISDERLVKALHQLLGYEHVAEGAVLSTCNRIEVYASATRFHGGAQDLRNFLAEFCHVAPEDFTDHIYTYHDEAAVRHLFRVASGIDSMIVGESEILGQVRRAYQVAFDEGGLRRVLGTAFSRALHVGKRSRTETAIGRNPISISSAAVELARRAFSEKSLAGKHVVIVGAGKMGRLAAQALATAGADRVTIVNRTEERATELAGRFPSATARAFEELVPALVEADIAICSTTAPESVIDVATMKRVVAERHRGRSLLIVDIGVPRDVEHEVGDLPGIELRDIEDLSGVVESNLGSRVAEITKVEDVITNELDRFTRWERAGEIGPTIAALVERAEAIRKAEVERAIGGRRLSEAERATIDRATKKIVGALLHQPLERARELAASKQGRRHLDALRELFELDVDDDG
ncbi:MAG: glutamyl-tRNA reductase [Actinobacteria bacterium]|nr:glutamyl-tRNA reductase [Actinomycetota bacterium]